MKPQNVFLNHGQHNKDLCASRDRIIRGNTYRNVNTVCVVPTRGMIPAKVVQSWMGLITPMNSAFVRIFVEKMRVDEAYCAAIDMIQSNNDLKKFPYILTLEEDNIPPPDGLLKLIQSINEGYDAVGGLYWTKGQCGQPMIYGDPMDGSSFRPQVPLPDTIQPCRGLGMGFTLFKTKMLFDKALPHPIFKTTQEWDQRKGVAQGTQDLYFFQNAGLLGYKFACDTRVKVGHYDSESDFVW